MASNLAQKHKVIERNVALLAVLSLIVVAIGGIEPARAEGLRAAGVHGVAVIRAILEAPDPAAATRAFLNAR